MTKSHNSRHYEIQTGQDALRDAAETARKRRLFEVDRQLRAHVKGWYLSISELWGDLSPRDGNEVIGRLAEHDIPHEVADVRIVGDLAILKTQYKIERAKPYHRAESPSPWASFQFDDDGETE